MPESLRLVQEALLFPLLRPKSTYLRYSRQFWFKSNTPFPQASLWKHSVSTSVLVKTEYKTTQNWRNLINPVETRIFFHIFSCLNFVWCPSTDTLVFWILIWAILLWVFFSLHTRQKVILSYKSISSLVGHGKVQKNLFKNRGGTTPHHSDS